MLGVRVVRLIHQHMVVVGNGSEMVGVVVVADSSRVVRVGFECMGVVLFPVALLLGGCVLTARGLVRLERIVAEHLHC